jgi:multifunctional methyltransferase subunit TRM112
MKLLTHNMLTSKCLKGVNVGYPLGIVIGHSGDLPRTLGDDYENDIEFLKKVHHVLLEVEVISGELVCPESGRKFSISKGIPNMLLNEDEL